MGFSLLKPVKGLALKRFSESPLLLNRHQLVNPLKDVVFVDLWFNDLLFIESLK